MKDEASLPVEHLTDQLAIMAINFATRAVFELDRIRGVLQPEGNKCVITICIDREGKGKFSHAEFDCSRRFGGTITKKTKERAHSAALCMSRGEEIRSDDTDGVKRYGIIVICAGFQPDICRLISSMVAELLYSLALSASMREHIPLEQSAA